MIRLLPSVVESTPNCTCLSSRSPQQEISTKSPRTPENKIITCITSRGAHNKTPIFMLLSLNHQRGRLLIYEQSLDTRVLIKKIRAGNKLHQKFTSGLYRGKYLAPLRRNNNARSNNRHFSACSFAVRFFCKTVAARI